MVGIHTWNKQAEKPDGYILGYSLISSGSGKDQAKADFHIISKQFGINNVGAMVGDNAKTQTGNKYGLVIACFLRNKCSLWGATPMPLILCCDGVVRQHLVQKVI